MSEPEEETVDRCGLCGRPFTDEDVAHSRGISRLAQAGQPGERPRWVFLGYGSGLAEMCAHTHCLVEQGQSA